MNSEKRLRDGRYRLSNLQLIVDNSGSILTVEATVGTKKIYWDVEQVLSEEDYLSAVAAEKAETYLSIKISDRDAITAFLEQCAPSFWSKILPHTDSPLQTEILMNAFYDWRERLESDSREFWEGHDAAVHS